MNTKEAGAKWGVTSAEVARLIRAGRVPGAYKVLTEDGCHVEWYIPPDTPKPAPLPVGRPHKPML